MESREAIARMIPPGAIKASKWCGGIIQVWVTRACDKSCFGCTQGSNLGGKPGMITLEQFEQAVENLRDYHGVVGVFGGNPAMHPQFPELCAILREHIPFRRRGLWCNNPLGHGSVMAQTFNPNVSNINVHQDRKAFDEFKRDWPSSHPFGIDDPSVPVHLRSDSRHSPPFAALQDLEDLTNEQRWEMISRCDINIHWSGLYGVFRGELRFWFCELAGAQSMLHQHEPDYPDTGLRVVPGVWALPMQGYAEQVGYHCMACGIPARGYGELANNPHGTEHVSLTHENIYKPKQRDRLVQLITTSQDLKAGALERATDYVQNGVK